MAEDIAGFILRMREISALSDNAVEVLMENVEEVRLPKGHILIESGKIERYTYFLVSGFARGFFYKDGKDVTIWFASPGMALLSMNAYFYGAVAGYENVELLESSLLLKISNETLERLFREQIELANLGRKMSDLAILRLEKMFMERSFIPAASRYHSLVEQEPEILRRVPLRHIASYLGISQVSLSRIRAGQQ